LFDEVNEGKELKMMTLIEKLAEFPVKTVNVQGQQQAYREAGQGGLMLVGFCQMIIHVV